MTYLPLILFTVLSNAAAQLMLKQGMLTFGPITTGDGSSAVRASDLHEPGESGSSTDLSSVPGSIVTAASPVSAAWINKNISEERRERKYSSSP